MLDGQKVKKADVCVIDGLDEVYPAKKERKETEKYLF